MLKTFNEEVCVNTYSNTVNGISILKSIVEEIDDGTFELKKTEETKLKSIEILEAILNNFHTIARQLKYRREDRATLEIKDEYDVQDLLHSLLHIPFNDIRPEEWTPSHGGEICSNGFFS